MRILYLGLAVPNLDDYLTMYTELMVVFREKGHEVVIAGPAYDSSISGVQEENGFTVIRVPTMKLFNVGKIQKGIANLLLPYQYKRALRKSGLDLHFDLVFMPTPPITLSDVTAWLKKDYGAKVYLILRDIFPQNAVDLNMMQKGSFIFKYFRKKEKKMYQVSDCIGCMSQGNIDYVITHNPEIKREKLHLLANWGAPEALISQQEVMAIKNEYGLQNKFIVIFGGNIGRPQRMENVVALARECLDLEDLVFLIIGGGTEKDRLEGMITREGLSNILLHDFLSRKRFFEVLHIADIALISLSQDFTIPNIPSKTVTYFNAKKPILASIDINTDYGKNLEELKAGLWAPAGDTTALKKQLLRLYHNPDLRLEMGENGYEYMQSKLVPDVAYSTIINHIQEK